ncbi:glutathione S-transferase family protein [Pseudooceanicola nanhaiensis]|uniref:glutathione S-transferase family protein n=1 Tax=Pseudooceanicola nanhaiensis TaxID=375761 RepID=UPI001CD48F3B|nr:glutathione S-transferase N-terminal domain-containing protein [Pseudooceanicola nanhaiensis]MCA0919315.1 glutathione S-transferase N-terminal domain-containing protein [Pseudooceanicola nanhaiensis]
MIDFYTWTTPNGRKVSILLEELGIPYTAHAVNIGKDEQFAPAFLAISPNNKIPAIHDSETGQSLMESGAIMLYLARKHGRFLEEGGEEWRVVEWLMWQMGGFGPMLGQTHHFHHFNPGKADYAEQRFLTETARLYRVLNDRLEGREYLAGTGAGSYSIADMAIWPWASRFEWQSINLDDYPNVKAWYLRIAERPAVQRGYAVPKDVGPIPMP